MDSWGRPIREKLTVDGERGIEAVRDAILEKLRVLPYANGNGLNILQVAPQISGQFAYEFQSDVLFMSAIWSLVRDGIIVPGRAAGISRQGYAVSGILEFPTFTVTPFGCELLRRQGVVHPLQVDAYLREARQRAAGVDDIVFTYLAEALQDHRNGCDLSASVMLGVSAEMLMKWLIARFIEHCPACKRHEISEERDKLWMRTDKLFDTFIRRIKMHFEADKIPRDLQLQVDAHLDQLQTLVRVTRDDVGHGRPQRADAQLVSGYLEVYLTLLLIVQELARALAATVCRLTG